MCDPIVRLPANSNYFFLLHLSLNIGSPFQFGFRSFLPFTQSISELQWSPDLDLALHLLTVSTIVLSRFNNEFLQRTSEQLVLTLTHFIQSNSESLDLSPEPLLLNCSKLKWGNDWNHTNIVVKEILQSIMLRIPKFVIHNNPSNASPLASSSL